MNLQSINHQQSTCLGVCNNIHPRASSQLLLPPRQSDHHADNNDGGLATEDQLQKKRELDQLLAQALTGLTFQERQEHQEIIHGVEERKAEEASFIAGALEALELYLISIKEGSMYELAEQMDPEYVHNKTFLVMFLRANQYDAKAAADQMIKFFESKYELFGKSKLTKDITMADLDEDAIAALESGWIQHAGLDRSGRQVFVHFGGVAVCDSPKALMGVIRSQFFFIMRAQKSEETQLRGSVSVWYALGNLKNTTNGKGYTDVYAAVRALPQKKAAIHVCVDDVYQYVLLNLSVKAMKGIVKARMRVHIGSHTECQYRLTTFGILSSSLPVNDQGRLDLSRHKSWLSTCAMEDNVHYYSSIASRALETTRTTSKPNQNDVLYRSGATSHETFAYVRL